MDVAKRHAYQRLRDELSDNVDLERFAVVNDYVFRAFRELWFVQKRLFEARSNYFQGKKTMPNPPDYKRDGEVKFDFGLHDRVDDWTSIGYTEEFVPVQLECHEYVGPHGRGFIAFGRARVNGDVWEIQMHIGPEEYRDAKNYQWKKLHPRWQ